MGPTHLKIHRLLWRVAFLALVLAVLSVWMRSRGVDPKDQMILLLIWLVVMVLAMWVFRPQKPLPTKPAAKPTTAKAKMAAHEARPVLATAKRGADGRFRVTVKLNGRAVPMIVDSGASGIALPYELITPLGADVRRLDYCLAVDTANGTSRAAPLVLPSLELGKARLTDVDAAVAEPGRLSEPLLGMSVISSFAEVVISGSQMEFRGKPN